MVEADGTYVHSAPGDGAKVIALLVMKKQWYRLVNWETGEKTSISSRTGPSGVWSQLDNPMNWIIKTGYQCSQLNKFWDDCDQKENMVIADLCSDFNVRYDRFV